MTETRRSFSDLLHEALGPSTRPVPLKGRVVRGPLDLLHLRAEAQTLSANDSPVAAAIEALLLDVARVQDLAETLEQRSSDLHRQLESTIEAFERILSQSKQWEPATDLVKEALAALTRAAATIEAPEASTLAADLAQQAEKVQKDVLSLVPHRPHADRSR